MSGQTTDQGNTEKAHDHAGGRELGGLRYFVGLSLLFGIGHGIGYPRAKTTEFPLRKIIPKAL